jgi:hypothetical protein
VNFNVHIDNNDMKTLRHARRDGIIGLNSRRRIKRKNVEMLEGGF